MRIEYPTPSREGGKHSGTGLRSGPVLGKEGVMMIMSM